jgi:imidazolonepropionase-like amidohydrolase
MNHISKVLLIVATLCCSGATASEENREKKITIVHAGTLLQVPGTSPLNQKSLVISEGKITDVLDGFVSEESYSTEATVHTIDLSDKFVMPGMMDMHVHLTLDNGVPRGDFYKTTDADFAMLAVKNAKITLMAGVTTVRDLAAASGEAIMAVRDAIDQNIVPGPRIVAAGSALSATAGHADHFAVREDFAQLYASTGVCDGADDCRRAVRDQYKIGADMIKVMATGGGADRNGKRGSAAEMFDDELLAIVETAHRLGLKVTAHAHGTDGINAALEAGVDSVEHSSYMDDKSIKLYKKNGAHLVATAALMRFFQRHPDIPDFVKMGLKEKALEVNSGLQKAYKRGVKFSMGTDAGISNHGENAEELAVYVDLGMTPMEAIQTATVNTAELLGMSDEIGTLEIGKTADIIAVDSSPLEDISILGDVSFVMRNGITYKQQ